MASFRARSILALAFAVLIGSGVSEAASRATPRDTPQRCVNVTVRGPVQFQGRTLVEMPDIEASELKRANVLISRRCFDEAASLLGEYSSKHPEDFRAAAVVGRYAWVTAGPDAAEQIFRDVLSKHSRFSGAQVLLAGLLFERGDLPAARAIIDELAASSPTDVWVYLNQLRFQAKEPNPPASLRDTLMAIAKEKGFDGNVREEATRLGRHLRQTPEQYEQFLFADVELESWTPVPCKRAALAAWLLSEGGRSREVITLLESPDGKIEDCGGLTPNRVTLARAYLLEAAKIGPGPTPANAKSVDRARALLDGDFGALVSAVVGRPDYATLRPFFVEEAHFDQPDEDGNTPLCMAVYSRDIEALKEQLEIGANPMQLCTDWQPVQLIMHWIGRQYAAERYEMVRLLLEAGAQPGDLSDCRNDQDSDCQTVLLPLLEKYSKKK